MANVTDPQKKMKIKVNMLALNTSPSEVRTGSAGKLSRDEKGKIQVRRDKYFAGMDGKTIREAQAQKRAAKEGDSHFSGVAAPRRGGKHHGGVTASGTKNKKLMIKTLKNIRRSDASPQAKRAAKRATKRG